ncbi:MAG: hypothetical protein ACTHOP_10270 [Mesorhizobium sp.]
MKKTGFFTDERTFWHSGGIQSLVLPVGGWVQPPSATGFAESPDSKRRFLSLLQLSGLAAKLEMRSATCASREDLLRVHPSSYLDAFKRVSDATGGDLGVSAPFGVGSYEIATLSAGLAMAAVDGVLSGALKNAFSLSRPPGHHCLPERIVIPAIEAFRPELIVVASGLDASVVDPLARMNLHSDSYRAMTASIVDAAERLCQRRLVVVHESGYSETYVPFCGHALVEALSGESSDVVDPLLPMALQWQPAERFNALQFEMIDEMAAGLKL